MNGITGRGAVRALALTRAAAALEGVRLEVLGRVRAFSNRELVALAAGRVPIRRAAAAELLRRGMDEHGRRLSTRERRARRAPWGA